MITSNDIEKLDTIPEPALRELVAKQGLSWEQFQEDLEAARFFSIFEPLVQKVESKYYKSVATCQT